MTKNIIRYAVFDAIESGNPNSNRGYYGNNRWSVSNIRQWLNSDSTGSWFTAQYTYNAPPTSEKIHGTNGTYADKPGFLAGFSSEVIQHLTEITNTTALCSLDGGGSETTVDKVFLPSYTEMGFGSNNGIAEGSQLSKFTSDASRIKSGQGTSYWLRSLCFNCDCSVEYVNDNGSSAFIAACNGFGIAPIIVLH